jgi:adenylosuccinate synthase
VLDGFELIKAATGYQIDGEEKTELPYDLCQGTYEPVYETFRGWNKSVSMARNKADFPGSFVDFLRFTESYLDTKIAFVSNGTGRDQLVSMD